MSIEQQHMPLTVVHPWCGDSCEVQVTESGSAYGAHYERRPIMTTEYGADVFVGLHAEAYPGGQAATDDVSIALRISSCNDDYTGNVFTFAGTVQLTADEAQHLAALLSDASERLSAVARP